MQAMPLRRSTAIILAAVALSAALVAGCSKSSSKNTENLPDAATLLKQSAETTKGVKSAHLELNVQGKIKSLPIQTLTGDLTNAPAVAAKGHTRITLAGDAAEAARPRQLERLRGRIERVRRVADPEPRDRTCQHPVELHRPEGRQPGNDQRYPDHQNHRQGQRRQRQQARPENLVQAKLEPSEGNSIQMTLSKWNEPVTVEKPPGV
jgi:lipoprotein LprG